MILNLSTTGDENAEDIERVAQEISNLLRVSVKLDSYPGNIYGKLIQPQRVSVTFNVQKDQIQGAIACDCGGIGGHSDWCATQKSTHDNSD